MNESNLMSNAKFYELYSRFNDELGRYETWDESVERVMAMHRFKYPDKMITNRVIAVTAEARHGKDETVDIILADSTHKYHTVTLAKRLKEIVMGRTGIPTVTLLDYHKNNDVLYNGINVRKFMQDTADEYTSVYPRYFVDIVIDEMLELSKTSPSDSIIITDLRMFVEHDALVEALDNLMVIKVIRPIDSIAESNHRSEQEVSRIPADYIIDNDGTLEDLKNKVQDVLKEID